MLLLHSLIRALIITFFFIAPVRADDPDDLISYPANQIMGFRGLDTLSSKPLIADSRASALENVKLSSSLSLKKREGFSVINDTLDDLDIDSPAITGIFDTEYSDGSSYTLAFVGSKLKYDNSGTWATVSGSSTITSGKNNQFQCVMALDSAICTNDTDVPIKIDSTPAMSDLNTSDLSDSLDKAKAVIWYRNYLIFGNTVENSTSRPTRFRWSNLGTIETYTDDDFTDIATFAGDEILGFAELYGDLFIFLTRSIWRASLVGGDDVFVFTKVIDGIGAIATDSIKVIHLSDNRTAVVFLDERKRVLMFNAAVVTDIGRLIQPSLDGLNESRLQYAVSTFDGDKYTLCASTSGITENDACYLFDINIFEWTKYTDINANALAQVKESTSVIKTYFGNYDSFVYWLDNPDLNNDVDGATGVIDSVGTVNSDTITGAQVLIDANLPSGDYTGAIVKIVSGTASGEEGVVVASTSTSLIVTQSFTTTPDSTSVYSVGVIDASYTTKPYDFGLAQVEKQFIGLLFWSAEQSNNEVTISHAIDFGSTSGSETVSLSPSGSSLWDSALWDQGTWGVTGDKIFKSPLSGFGNVVEITFENNDVDESFEIFGYHLIGLKRDTKMP